MITAIVGEKIKQSQAFTEDGRRVPVTVISAKPSRVVRVTDLGGKKNVQLAYGTVKHQTKAIEGVMKKAGVDMKPRFLREVGVSADTEVAVGDEVAVASVLAAGDKVRVTGISKGKGFAGVVKRHGFAGGPKTHGQSDRERSPGSIGQTTTPGRVYRGKRMAGRMGGDTVTLKNLSIVSVNAETHEILVKGLIPGGKGSLVVIKKESK